MNDKSTSNFNWLFLTKFREYSTQNYFNFSIRSTKSPIEHHAQLKTELHTSKTFIDDFFAFVFFFILLSLILMHILYVRRFTFSLYAINNDSINNPR